MKSRDGKSQRREEKRREEKRSEGKGRGGEGRGRGREAEGKGREGKRREEKRREKKKEKREKRKEKREKRREEKRRDETRREEKKKEDQKRESLRRKKIQVREKVGKSRNTVFPMICGFGGSKSRLAKAAGAEPAGQMRDEKLHAVVARSTFRSQNVQNTPAPDHFWKLRCRKSARRCQNVQNTPAPEHFWKLRCRKSARPCGAKHILKSKCTKQTILGPLLEVEMSKNVCRCGAKQKTPQPRSTFGS